MLGQARWEVMTKNIETLILAKSAKNSLTKLGKAKLGFGQ